MLLARCLPMAIGRRVGVALAGCVVASILLLSGCEQREIVRPTPQMGIETRFWIRVLLLSNATECTLKAPSAIRAARPTLGPEISVAPVVLSPDTPARVALAGGQLTFGGTPAPIGDVMVNVEKPYIFTLNGRDYRGKLELTVNSDGCTFNAINLVPLEAYLAGVVGAEMPDYWEPEALKAQAIAARTYCLYVKKRFGVNRSWDVSSTQASQVYRGVSAESAQVWNAVTDTYGMVLVSAGQPTADAGLFPAYYSAICGGHTEDSERVFGDAFKPLRGVACPYCKDVARLGLFFWPMAQFDKATVTSQLVKKYPSLKTLGEIKDIVPEEKNDYGEFSRLTKVRLVGSTGRTDTLRGEDLRLALDPSGRKLQSTICQIVPWGNGWAFLSGRGWGHGVGMCQYGAEGMARLGKKAREILWHYYPGSEIVDIY
jgi:stage II sporulation protein D